jgi:hypothetical protein
MLNYLRTRAFARGVLGDSRPFLAIWILLAGFRLIKRLAGSEPKVVFREELQPGESLVISHTAATHG